jgi:hypothetical protein
VYSFSFFLHPNLGFSCTTLCVFILVYESTLASLRSYGVVVVSSYYYYSSSSELEGFSCSLVSY